MLSLLALAATASAVTITPAVSSAFADFQQKFGKTYESGEEFAKRLEIFAQNVERVNSLNAEHVLVGGEAVHGVTKFMDLTPAEFRSQFLTYIAPEANTTRVELAPTASAGRVDWTAAGKVTAVKDQGQCGSCWAFSATAAIESYGALSGKYDLIKLSAQQINSCDKVDQGCNGGNTETAYQYVKGAGGIETDASYPYTSGAGITGVCKFNAANIKVSITGYTSVATGEASLKTAVNAGPASICLAAEAFQTYSSGILSVCPGSIDHCVQATGYDDTAATPYWIVRNSWGTSWGEQGYIRVKQGGNLCKISNDITYPNF